MACLQIEISQSYTAPSRYDTNIVTLSENERGPVSSRGNERFAFPSFSIPRDRIRGGTRDGSEQGFVIVLLKALAAFRRPWTMSNRAFQQRSRLREFRVKLRSRNSFLRLRAFRPDHATNRESRNPSRTVQTNVPQTPAGVARAAIHMHREGALFKSKYSRTGE